MAESRARRGDAQDLAPATLAVWAGEDEATVEARPRCRSSTARPTATPTSTAGWTWRWAGGRATSTAATPTPPCTPSRRRSAPLEGGCSGHQLRDRHGGHQQHAVHAAAPGRPRRLGQGHLRRHEQDLHRSSCRASGSRWTSATRTITRSIEAAIAEGCRVALPGNAHQPDAQGARHRAAGSGRARRGRDRRGRQHLRHAHQPESAGPGRRPGAPQRHQVPGRPRRCAGRRRLRRCGPGRAHLPLPRDHGRDARPDGGLSAAARHEDARTAHPPAERERPAHRPLARSASRRVEVVYYPGLEPIRASRRRRAADARLRRRAELHAWRAASRPSSASCRGCASRTAPPTWARSKRSPDRPPPPATSSARPRNARPWASPKA